MDVDVVFINVILLATLASNMPPMHFVCHLIFFRYWVDSRDHLKNDFKKSRIDLGAKLVYGPNREMTQNIGTKSAFTSRKFKQIDNIPLVCSSHV